MPICMSYLSIEACSFHAVIQGTATCSKSAKYKALILLYRFNGESLRNRKSTKGKNDNKTEEKD